MKPSLDQRFNAKILLFGEYSLLCGSKALSIPFDRFYGNLVWPEDSTSDAEDKLSNEQIKKFFDYILNLKKENILSFDIDIDRLGVDIQHGLYFKSNIPQGYGLGSSGALVAAFFKEYGKHNDAEFYASSSGLLKLKSFFATLESYFHGKSSGLDPMISYLSQAILISSETEIETLSSTWKINSGRGAIFLIDSGLSGETQPLVNQFRINLEDKSFSDRLNNQLMPFVDSAIQSYISGEVDSLLASANVISDFQAKYFEKMIPDSVKDIWNNGLETKKYSIKLCGSGGGGMMLGFTNDISATKKELGDIDPIIIHSI